MNKRVKRRLAAWLLLMVYVPLTVAISLHVHEDTAASADVVCAECANHIHHGGHLDVYSDNVHDCVLCQLASLSYVVPSAVVVAVVVRFTRVAYTERSAMLRLGLCRVKSTRAPPAF